MNILFDNGTHRYSCATVDNNGVYETIIFLSPSNMEDIWKDRIDFCLDFEENSASAHFYEEYGVLVKEDTETVVLMISAELICNPAVDSKGFVELVGNIFDKGMSEKMTGLFWTVSIDNMVRISGHIQSDGLINSSPLALVTDTRKVA